MTAATLEQLKAQDLFFSSDIPSSSHATQTASAAKLWQKQTTTRKYRTGSSVIDVLLAHSQSLDANTPIEEGGLAVGRLLEVSSPPGEGKTRFCISCALQARASAMENEEDTQVLLIDTEGGLTSENLYEAALALGADNADQICAGIQRMECADYVQFFGLINTLPSWLQHNPKVRLVIFDSISHPLRLGIHTALPDSLVPKHDHTKKRQRKNDNELSEQNIRSNMLAQVRKCMVALLSSRDITVIATTQSRTQFAFSNDDERRKTSNASTDSSRGSTLIPASGDGWHPPDSARLLLYPGLQGQRFAAFNEPGENMRGPVRFVTTAAGIADCVTNE